MTKKIEKPKAILFDWDGTLVDTIPWLLVAHNYVRTEMGHPTWSLEDFKGVMKYSSLELYGTLYEDKKEHALKILYDYVEENHLDSINILPGATELIHEIVDLGLPIGIVSNKKHKYLVREIEHLGWTDKVSAIVGAGHAARDKPAADPILKALEYMALDPDRDNLWYIGDTEPDMRAANASGCKPVLILNGHDGHDLIEQYKPFFVAEDCSHLQNVIKTCNPTS